jgi:hypothetical protein
LFHYTAAHYFSLFTCHRIHILSLVLVRDARRFFHGDHVQLEEAKKGHFMYAHEISGGSIPELAYKLHVPKYFINNVRDLESEPNVTIDWMIRTTHFPSIFFGAPGSSSPLHSDGTSTQPPCRAPTNRFVRGAIIWKTRPTSES